MQVINKVTGEDVTKHYISYLSGEISRNQFERFAKLTTEHAYPHYIKHSK